MTPQVVITAARTARFYIITARRYKTRTSTSPRHRQGALTMLLLPIIVPGNGICSRGGRGGGENACAAQGNGDDDDGRASVSVTVMGGAPWCSRSSPASPTSQVTHSTEKKPCKNSYGYRQIHSLILCGAIPDPV